MYLSASSSHYKWVPVGVWSRGEVLPIMVYTERLRPKWVPFSGFRSGIWKGRDFTCWSIWKSREIGHFGRLKAGPEGLTDAFCGCENVRVLWFIHRHFKDSRITPVKGMQISNKVYERGTLFLIESIQKGLNNSWVKKTKAKNVKNGPSK